LIAWLLFDSPLDDFLFRVEPSYRDHARVVCSGLKLILAVNNFVYAKLLMFLSKEGKGMTGATVWRKGKTELFNRNKIDQLHQRMEKFLGMVLYRLIGKTPKWLLGEFSWISCSVSQNYFRTFLSRSRCVDNKIISSF